MIKPPTIESYEQYRSCRGEVDCWWPYLREILNRHGMIDASLDPVAGFNTTYPTFVYGDVAVKLFGYMRTWSKGFEAERAAYGLLATDPEILAPRVLADGHLFDDADASWPYLITRVVPGVASWRAELSREQQRALAAALGEQVRRLHALQPTGVATQADWPPGSIRVAAEQSSLPPHLVAQVDSYIAGLEPFDEVFIHSDIIANHIYVENGQLTGIIDWGDAMVTDRHCEIIQIYRDLFDCDGTVLRVFLDASNWPADGDFPRKALGFALYRQAFGIAQHLSIDVFEPIAEQFPLDDIATLDELAHELFAV